MSRALASLPTHDAAIAEAESAHRARLLELAHARREMLPPDAVAITHGADDNYHDERRWPVGYVTADGEGGSLGGCSNIRDQIARVRWFEAELSRRAATQRHDGGESLL